MAATARGKSREWRPGLERGAAYCLVITLPSVLRSWSMSIRMPCSPTVCSRCFCRRK